MARLSASQPTSPRSHGITLMMLCLLVAMTPLVFAVRLFEPYTSAKEILIQAGTATTALIWLLTGRTSSWNLPRTAAWIPLLVLALVGAASTLWSPSPSVSLLETQRLATYLLLFAIALTLMGQIESRATLAAALVLAGAIEAVYVLMQFGFGDPIFLTGQLPGKWQTFGTLGNPNWTGEFLAVACLVSLGRFTHLNHKSHTEVATPPFERYSTLAALVLMLLALTATLARGAWVAFIVGALAFVLVRRGRDVPSRSRSFILPVTVTVASAVMLVVLPLLTNREAINHLFNFRSIRGRLLMWEVTATMVRDMPWSGHGLGTFGLKFPVYQAETLSEQWAAPFVTHASFTSYAHNDYLQLWAELGIFGVLTFGALVWIVLKRGRALAGEPLALGCWAAVISLLVNAAVAFPMHLPASLMLFVVLVAVVEAAAANKTMDLASSPIPARVAIVLLVLILSLSAYWLSYDRLKTEAALWRADTAFVRGSSNDAEADIRIAIEHGPNRLEGHVMLARLHVERGEYKEALPILERARAIGFDVEIFDLKAKAHTALSNYREAVITLNELVRLRPDLRWPHDRIAELEMNF